MESEEHSPPPRFKNWPAFALIGAMFVAIIAISRTYFVAAPIPEASPTDLPNRVGDIWFCPPDKRIAAFEEGRVYFPPNHPSPPPKSEKPQRCFPNEMDARQAGYAPAPPPPGGEIIRGVYFISRSQQLLERCRGVAERLGYAVPCPRLLPAPTSGKGEEISCWSGDGTCAGGFLRYSWNFGLPLARWTGPVIVAADISATPTKEYLDYGYGPCGEGIFSETDDFMLGGSMAIKNFCRSDTYITVAFLWSHDAVFYRLGLSPSFMPLIGEEEISLFHAVGDRLAESIEMVR